MDSNAVLSDHQMLKYRELLDGEDAAFDELEHACEDGDRGRFVEAMQGWQSSFEAKQEFLTRTGVLAAFAQTNIRL